MKEFPVVSSEESKEKPYPYVYVEENGAYRELLADEKEYLEEEYNPCDGARPYVKFRYYSKTPDNKISGFLHRKKLIKGIREGETPPPRPWWRIL